MGLSAGNTVCNGNREGDYLKRKALDIFQGMNLVINMDNVKDNLVNGFDGVDITHAINGRNVINKNGSQVELNSPRFTEPMTTTISINDFLNIVKSTYGKVAL